MPSPTCPIREELKLYAVGKLDDERSDEIDAHLDDCTDCQALLGTIGAADDTLLDSLKQPVEEDPYIREAECQEALALVQAIGREPSFIRESAFAAVGVESADLGQIRDYRLLAKLGEGGMGTVYKALHTHLNKIVALKLLPREQTADENAVARFRREMQAVGALEHPNIVRATDAGEHEGVHFLVMEYVKGQDLSQVSKQQGPLPIAEACELVRRAAVGLQHAFEHGLIHRDVKPSNLMLSNSGEVKVLDLGLALLQEQHIDSQRDLTSTGQMMGTIDYMAPEQGDDSHEVDIRADVYSLGATLYRLLCGQAPFADGKYNKPVKKLRALAIEPVPPIDQRRPEVPPELAAVVHRMLEKERDDRPATPGEVATLLEPFAAGSDLTRLVPPVEAEPDETPSDPSRSKSTSSHYSSALQDTTRWRSTPEKNQPSASVAERSTTPAIGASPHRQGAGPLVAIAVGLAVILALATVLTLHTKNGVVEIALAEGVEAKDVQVEVLQGGEQIEIADAKQGWKIQLANGHYRLNLGNGADRFELSQDTVVVRRGDKVRVKVTQRTFPDDAAPVAVAEASVRDREKADAIARTSPPEAKPNPFDRAPPHLEIEQNEPISQSSLVSHPAKIEGLRSWTIETRGNRHHTYVSYSPDGRWLVASSRGTLRLFDARSLEFVRAFSIGGTTWTPDSQGLVGFGSDGVIRLVERNSGRVMKSLSAHTPQNEVFHQRIVWSSNGKWLASVNIGNRASELIVWDAAAFEPHLTHKIAWTKWSPFAITWSPDSNLLGFSTGQVVRRLNAAEETFLPDLAVPRVDRLCWLADGKHLALDGSGFACQVWNPEANELINELGRGEARAVSPDHKSIVSDDSGTIKIVDAQSGKVLQRCTIAPYVGAPSNSVASVDWSPDAKSLAVGTARGDIQMFDVASGLLTRRKAGHEGVYVHDAEWSPDVTKLAVGNSDDLRLYDILEVRQQHVLPGFGARIAWAADGKTLAAGHSRIRLCNPENGKILREVVGRNATWHPDGNVFCVVQGNDAWIVDATSGENIRRLEHDATVGKCSWSSDGRRLVTSHSNGDLIMWDPTSGKKLYSAQGVNYEKPVRWSPDSRMVAAVSRDGSSIQLYDGNTLKLAHTLTGHVGRIRALHWSSDGKTLLSGGQDGTVRRWNATSGSLQGTTIGPVADSFSPDGRYSVFSGGGGYGDRVQIYENRTGELLASIFPLSGKAWVCVSPDGHWRGSEGIQDDLLYIALTVEGEQLTLTPDEFQRTYGWKNDPKQVKLTVD